MHVKTACGGTEAEFLLIPLAALDHVLGGVSDLLYDQAAWTLATVLMAPVEQKSGGRTAGLDAVQKRTVGGPAH